MLYLGIVQSLLFEVHWVLSCFFCVLYCSCFTSSCPTLQDLLSAQNFKLLDRPRVERWKDKSRLCAISMYLTQLLDHCIS